MGSLHDLISFILKENSLELYNYWNGVSPVKNSSGLKEDLVIATNFFKRELGHVNENKVNLELFYFLGYQGDLVTWIDNFKKIALPALLKNGFLSTRLDFLLTENF